MNDLAPIREGRRPPARRDENLQIERAEVTLATSPFYVNMRSTLRWGVLWAIVPFGLLLAGLMLFPIPGAVISSGFLVAESAAKKIQAPETAVVAEINVRDGDRVVAGQVLIQLDDTPAKSELHIVQQSIDRLEARSARLGAEALNLDHVIFPEHLTNRPDDPAVQALIAAEGNLFDLRIDTYRTQISQMNEQAVQIDEQVRGVNGQVAAATIQYDLAVEQAENLGKLAADQLIERSRLVEVQQQVAALEGQKAQYEATIALAKARKAELTSQVAELTSGRMSESAADQRETQGELSDLYQQQIAVQKRVEQLRLLAPDDGIVSELKVRTIGGVVTASEQVVTITPVNDRLIAELQISPRDAPNVYVGQPAELHFSAIGGSNAPQFAGEVLYLSPDVIVDQRTGVPHFTVRVALGEPLNDKARTIRDFGSGMPVEVYLLKEAQPIIAYIARPVVEQAQRAFR